MGTRRYETFLNIYCSYSPKNSKFTLAMRNSSISGNDDDLLLFIFLIIVISEASKFLPKHQISYVYF